MRGDNKVSGPDARDAEDLDAGSQMEHRKRGVSASGAIRLVVPSCRCWMWRWRCASGHVCVSKKVNARMGMYLSTTDKDELPSF